MRCIWIASDLHLGHKNICKFRTDFSTPEDHDNTVFNNIISKVNKRDTLWLLGDTCFNEESYRLVKELSKAVMNLNYIPGNHDTDNNIRQEMYKKMIKEDLLHKTGSMFKLGKFWLTHPPIHPKELRGKLNIHGHTHYVHMDLENGLEIDGTSKLVRDERYINICVENWDYGPIKYQNLIALNMQDKTYGWTVEMQLKALKQKLTYTEVAMKYRNRIGVSKVSGTVKGSIFAGVKILSWIFKYSFK